MQQLTSLKEIEQAIDLNGEIVLKRNSENKVIIMSMAEYNETVLKKEIIEKLKQSEKEIDNGEGIDAEVALAELRQKYEYDE